MSIPPNEVNSATHFVEVQDVKPSKSDPSKYEANYVITLAGSPILERGFLSLNVPNTDYDSNGLQDWLQYDLACNAQVSGYFNNDLERFRS